MPFDMCKPLSDVGKYNIILSFKFTYFTTIKSPKARPENPDKFLKSPKARKARKWKARENSILDSD